MESREGGAGRPPPRTYLQTALWFEAFLAGRLEPELWTPRWYIAPGLSVPWHQGQDRRWRYRARAAVRAAGAGAPGR